jgi:anti-sigma factor RsiW
MTHDPVEELLGAYALNAVDDEERAQVEAHLATCPRCRHEVDQHREVAAHLARSGAPAPDGLWDRIAEVISTAEAPPPLRLVVDDGTRTRATRSRWWSRAGIAAMAAAAVAIVALGVSSVNQRDRIDELEQASGVTTAANEAFADPTARIAELRDPDGALLVRAAVLDDGSGYVLAGALPELDGQIYQLWGATADQVVSLGTMGSSPGVVAFPADPSITQLMITAEDEPVPAPTSDPLAAGALA